MRGVHSFELGGTEQLQFEAFLFQSLSTSGVAACSTLSFSHLFPPPTFPRPPPLPFFLSLAGRRQRRRGALLARAAAYTSDEDEDARLPPAPVRSESLAAAKQKAAAQAKSKKKKVVDPRPPRPDTKVFFKDDAERIRDLGASGTDITARTTFLVEDATAGWPAPGSPDAVDESRVGELVEAEYKWVPITVTGDAFVGEEPQWSRLEEMPALELLRGLRERNWTDAEAYNPDAMPWSV